MTEFSVTSRAVTFENLEWDYTPPEGGFVQSGTIDVASFSAAQLYPEGYLKSGLILAKSTAGGNTGLLIPYLEAGTNGASTAVGVLRASVPITRFTGVNRTKTGVAYLVHGVVSVSKLPYTVGNAALGGYLDAPARADLPLIYWAA